MNEVQIVVNGRQIDRFIGFDDDYAAAEFGRKLANVGKTDPTLSGVKLPESVPYTQGKMPSPLSPVEDRQFHIIAEEAIQGNLCLFRGYFYGTEAAFLVLQTETSIMPVAVLLRPEDGEHMQDPGGRTPYINHRYEPPC